MEEEQERLRQAIDFTLLDLMTLTAKAETSGLDDIAAIFSGHHTLLDDPELQAAQRTLQRQTFHGGICLAASS